MIDHLIRSKIKEGGGELDERTELGKHISKRMPLHNQARLEALYNSWVVYWRVPYQLQMQQQNEQQKVKLRIRTKQRRNHQGGTSSARSGIGSGSSSNPRVDSSKRAAVTGGGLTSATGNNGGGPEGFARGKAGGGDDDDDGGGWETRSERLREKAEEVKHAVLTAASFATVVLKGSMWQPLVRDRAMSLGWCGGVCAK